MEYELWLDESGDFINEGEKKHNRNILPSLVGGILLKRSVVPSVNLNEIIDNDRRHANELEQTDKVTYILPILERMKEEYGAVQVFFENREYDDQNSRSLYLNIISEGILQLMQYLNSLDESVNLYVIIAQRQDVNHSETGNARRIAESEYINELKRIYEEKRKDRHIYLNDKNRLNFTIDIADRNKKLQIADFACNTRLTRRSATFNSSEIQDRIRKLYDDCLEFSLYERSSENYIRNALSRGSITDAVFELYSSIDNLNEKKILDQIMERIEHMNYRLIKSQLKELETDIISYVANIYDFEKGEAFLKKILKGFIKHIYTKTSAYPNLQCTVYMNLADMYLREGAILEARDILEEAELVFEKVEQNFDNWMLFYQLKEKKALYYIDSFQYEKAVEQMKEANRFFGAVFSVLRPENAKSEYYGDSLCMMIYALLFIQRDHPELYNEMLEYSDTAMKQYPNYEGELERHRQYRSHIELEHGDYENSLKWLIRAKLYDADKVDEESLNEFFVQIEKNEGIMSCQYYLMYYLLIMAEAERNGSGLAHTMNVVLNKNEAIKRKTGLAVSGQRNLINDLKKDYSDKIEYHPMEIVYWKLASYLSLQKNREESAKFYFKKACSICFEHDNYLTMKITGLGIAAEYLSVFEDEQIENMAVLTTEEIMKLNLDEGTEKFAEEFSDGFAEARENRRERKHILFDLSRKITY